MSALNPQEYLQLARFSLDHAEDAAFWADADGHFLYMNAAGCHALAYTAAELLGMTLFQVSPELTPELWAQLWKEIKTRESFAFEFSLKSKDNRTFPVEITALHTPLPDRDILCAYFRDVNERKRLQQMKNEFVSTVSHELRTPMTIIRESVSQVMDGLWGDVPAPQKDALTITLSGIDRLSRMINDLLDVSKMEAGKASLRWDQVDLGLLIQEVVDTFTPRARDRALELKAVLPSQPVQVYGDPERIVQVLTNLIGNALKFSEKGKIEVVVRDKPAEIECVVKDTGLGIAPEDFDKVFNKFEQLGQSVTGEKGSGLGLSICKGIVELHQGRIWVESTLGQGSSFIFTLPKRTPKDLFQQKISVELTQAATNNGNVTAVFFDLQLDGRQPAGADALFTWAAHELAETVKSHARKTDITLRDTRGAWLGLTNTTRKEASRVVDLIVAAYNDLLRKKVGGGRIHVTARIVCFPEDVQTQREFLSRLQGDSSAHAA